MTFHEHRTGNESFDRTFKIPKKKTFGAGHSNSHSVGGWLITFKEVCSVFTFKVKQYCIWTVTHPVMFFLHRNGTHLEPCQCTDWQVPCGHNFNLHRQNLLILSILPKICSFFLHMFLCSLFKQSEILSATSVSYPLISSYLVLRLMRHWSILIAMSSIWSEKFFPQCISPIKFNLMSRDISLRSW